MSEKEVESLTNLPVPEDKVKAAAAEIDFSNPALTVEYGTKTMGEIAKFADSVLSNVKVKDSGEVGQSLTDLMAKVKGINVDGIISGKKGFLESLPLIGGLFDSVKSAVEQFDTVSEQIDKIAQKLDDSQLNLLKDIEILEQLYAHNSEFYSDLSAYIKAGEQRLEEARKVDLPELEEKAKQSQDNMDAQKVKDLADAMNRFERRLHDLKLSRTITLQTAPQIRMIQNNDRSLAEKIQTSVLATIPIWKNQMVLALSLHGQSEAAKLQKEVADTTNDMLKKNADLLHSATVDTAREVERGIVDVETLRDVQGKLISTIEETMAIADEARVKRQQTEKELENMEADLRAQLTNLSARKTASAINAARGQTETEVEATVEDADKQLENKQ